VLNNDRNFGNVQSLLIQCIYTTLDWNCSSFFFVFFFLSAFLQQDVIQKRWIRAKCILIELLLRFEMREKSFDLKTSQCSVYTWNIINHSSIAELNKNTYVDMGITYPFFSKMPSRLESMSKCFSILNVKNRDGHIHQSVFWILINLPNLSQLPADRFIAFIQAP